MIRWKCEDVGHLHSLKNWLPLLVILGFCFMGAFIIVEIAKWLQDK